MKMTVIEKNILRAEAQYLVNTWKIVPIEYQNHSYYKILCQSLKINLLLLEQYLNALDYSALDNFTISREIEKINGYISCLQIKNHVIQNNTFTLKLENITRFTDYFIYFMQKFNVKFKPFDKISITLKSGLLTYIEPNFVSVFDPHKKNMVSFDIALAVNLQHFINKENQELKYLFTSKQKLEGKSESQNDHVHFLINKMEQNTKEIRTRRFSTQTIQDDAALEEATMDQSKLEEVPLQDSKKIDTLKQYALSQQRRKEHIILEKENVNKINIEQVKEALTNYNNKISIIPETDNIRILQRQQCNLL